MLSNISKAGPDYSNVKLPPSPQQWTSSTHPNWSAAIYKRNSGTGISSNVESLRKEQEKSVQALPSPLLLDTWINTRQLPHKWKLH
eukprot:15364842-Ditylum_brightwellii.AAC.1